MFTTLKLLKGATILKKQIVEEKFNGKTDTEGRREMKGISEKEKN